MPNCSYLAPRETPITIIIPTSTHHHLVFTIRPLYHSLPSPVFRTAKMQQSLRRVALRTVASAARATAAPKAPSSQFAKNMVVKQSAASMARYFSQSVRMMEENNEDKSFVSQVAEKVSEVAGKVTDSAESSTQEPAQDLPNGIWVRNFVFDVNEDHLKDLFSKFGNVVEARIVRDPRGLSRGFGFVYMDTAEAKSKAVQELNGSFWHGRRVHMADATGTGKRASSQPNAERSNSNRLPSEPTRYLYIGNIPYESTDAELNRMFRGLENLEDVRVAVDRVTGFPRGFAHADFTDVESATKALEKLSGFEFNGRNLRVDYAGSDQRQRGDNKGRRGQRDNRRDNRQSSEIRE